MSGTIVVTGASTGIGRATALQLAELGFRVLAGVRTEADGEKLGSSVEPVLVDVTDAALVAALAAHVGEEPLAGLVDNAGIAHAGPLEHVELDDLRHQLEVNVVAHVGVTRALLPALRRGRGRVVNIGSIGGRGTVPFNGPYSMSKFAMRSFSDTLRQELRPDGIKVVLIEPGAIATEIWRKGLESSDEVLAGYSPEAIAQYGERIASFRKTVERTARTAIPPEKCAAVVVKALTTGRPRAHYLVGVDAHVLAIIDRMPTPMRDRVIRLATRT